MVRVRDGMTPSDKRALCEGLPAASRLAWSADLTFEMATRGGKDGERFMLGLRISPRLA